MGMPYRFLFSEYMIDANRANAKGRLFAMNQLQKWAEDGVISLIISDTARDEIARGGSAARLRRVDGQVYTQTVITTDEQCDVKGKNRRNLGSRRCPQPKSRKRRRHSVSSVS